MQRIVVAAPVLVIALAGCAPASAAPKPASSPLPAAAVSRAPPAAAKADGAAYDRNPIVVGYRVTRGGAADPALLEGETALQPGRLAAVERRDRAASQEASLTFRTRPLDDDRVLIEAEYDELSEGTRRIRWAPTVVVRRGIEVRTHVGFEGGDGRTLVLTIR